MPFRKSKQLETRVTGDFWKIISIALDRIECSATVIFGLYLSEIDKNLGGTPIDTKTIFVPPEHYEFESEHLDEAGMNVTKKAYQKSKLVDVYFMDAEDIIK